MDVWVTLDRIKRDEIPHYRVVVEDSGPGIPDWKKWQVFGRLKEGQTSGKGFGLYMVRTLVEHFRGTITVEDRVPGNYAKGARFVVLLPSA